MSLPSNALWVRDSPRHSRKKTQSAIDGSAPPSQGRGMFVSKKYITPSLSSPFPPSPPVFFHFPFPYPVAEGGVKKHFSPLFRSSPSRHENAFDNSARSRYGSGSLPRLMYNSIASGVGRWKRFGTDFWQWAIERRGGSREILLLFLPLSNIGRTRIGLLSKFPKTHQQVSKTFFGAKRNFFHCTIAKKFASKN